MYEIIVRATKRQTCRYSHRDNDFEISMEIVLMQASMLDSSENFEWTSIRRRNFERILIGKASSPPGVARGILFDTYGRGRVYVNVILCGGDGAEITTKPRQINRFCTRMWYACFSLLRNSSGTISPAPQLNRAARFLETIQKACKEAVRASRVHGAFSRLLL